MPDVGGKSGYFVPSADNGSGDGASSRGQSMSKEKNSSANDKALQAPEARLVPPGAAEELPVAAESARHVLQSLNTSPESEQNRLRKILDLSPLYFVLLDEEGNILYKNKGFDDFFGKNAEPVCYKAMRGYQERCSFCPPLDSLKTKSTCAFEWVSPKTHHAYRVYCYPFEESPGRWLMLKVGYSVTASVRVRHALDLTESSYRAITDNLAIGVAIISTDLRIKIGNTRLMQWFGGGIGPGSRVCKVLRCNGAEQIPPAKQYCPDCPFYNTLQDGTPHEKEFTCIFADGHERTVRLVACPISPRKKKIQAFVLMLEDITKRLEVSKRLQAVRKLEAMGTLAAGIAHEINQPLSALHLYASSMQMMLEKKGTVDVDAAMERLNLIMNEAEKIKSIIATMRALVMREGDVAKGPTNVLEAINAAVSIMGSQFTAHNIHIEMHVAPNVPLVISNKVQLERVIINLLSNAMHAIDILRQKQNGHIKTGFVRIRVAPIDEGKRVRIAVADNGTGLPDTREKIFEPFYSTKSGEGMGLGLSIVHSLMRQWGGEVSALSRTKDLGGAEFYLSLNVAEDLNTEIKTL